MQPAVRRRRVLASLVALALATAAVVSTAPAAYAGATPPTMSKAHWMYFGWQGDHPKSLAFVGGELSPGGGAVIQYFVTSGGSTFYPNENASDLRNQASWTLASGYLPSPISSWPAGSAQVTIQHAANSILSGAATAVFTRATVANPTGAALSLTLNISAAPTVEIPLSGAPSGSDTTSMFYTLSIPSHASVSKDFVTLAAGSATSTQLSASGGFDTNLAAMTSYWNGRLASIAMPTSLPDPQLISMYKAEQITLWESIVYTNSGQDYDQRASGGNISGLFSYDGHYNHDVPDIAGQYIREGDYATGRAILASSYYQNFALNPDSDYLDALPKFIEPYDLYQRDANDSGFFTTTLKNKIEAAAHLVASYRVTTAGDAHLGLMQASNTLDNGTDYLVTDNMSAIAGLQAYANLTQAWGSSWSSETTWAQGQATSINSALNAYLTAHTLPRLDGYYNACLDACGKVGTSYNGNWLGTTIMMSSLPWDGQLAGNTNTGTWQSDLNASTYGVFTKRADTAPSIPPHSWGAWSSDSNGYGTTYNAGAGAQLLGSSDPYLRTEAISDLEWSLANQSAPMNWGESFAQGSWSTPLADLESWGLAGNQKALLESNISIAADHTAIIGRGIPTSWIMSGRTTSWSNVPIGGGATVGFTVTPLTGNQVKLTLTGSTGAAVKFELPLFVNNISTATAGTIDQASGIVTLAAGVTTTTVTYGTSAATPITVANSTAGGYTFGQTTDQTLRAQTFFASSAPTLSDIKVDIRKINGSAQTDVTVGLYAVANGSPTGSPLATTTIPAASVTTSFTTLTAPLSYTGLVDGRSYAIVLGQTTPNGSDYEWATTGANGVYDFQKSNGTTWTHESNLGDAWLTVDVQGALTMSPDLSNSGAGHYSFGQSSDQVQRGELFVDTGISTLHDVRLEIRKTGGTAQTNVTAALYAVANGVPTGTALATTTIPATSVGTSDTIVDVTLSAGGMVPGNEYAIVLGQQTPGTSSYYEWATSGSGGTSGFGKFVPGGAWVDESSLGDGWLQVSGALN